MLRYHNLYHDLLSIVIIIVAGRGRVTAWRVLGHAIQNLVVSGTVFVEGTILNVGC